MIQTLFQRHPKIVSYALKTQIYPSRHGVPNRAFVLGKRSPKKESYPSRSSVPSRGMFSLGRNVPNKIFKNVSLDCPIYPTSNFQNMKLIHER